MKKILLFNNLNGINQLLKIKKKFDEIIVFDYRLAIICNQKKIDFIYINDLNKRKQFKQNLSDLLHESHYISKEIDKNICSLNKNLNGNNFFTNYHKFPLCKTYLDKYYDDLKFLLKKYPEAKFYYFKKNSINFDFLTECVEVYKSKFKKKFVKISNVKLKLSVNNLYPILHDDTNVNPIKNILKLFINLNKNEEKKILIYLLEKNYVKKIEKFSKTRNISINYYVKHFFNKKYFDEILIKRKFKIDTFKDKLKNYFLEKLVIYLSKYIINEVLATKENIAKIFKTKKIDLFCSSHNTLISNTIREYLNEHNVKSLSFLHGGTVGHFKKGFFWPDLSYKNLKYKKLSFCQSYSKQHLKDILKNEKNLRGKFKSHYVSFKPENFIKLKKNKKSQNSKFNIGYITQSNNNLLIGLNKNYNDPYNLYKFRTNFIKKILKNKNKIKLHLSTTEDDNNFLFNYNEFKNSEDLKKIYIYKLNAIEVLKKVNTVILEQPSTTLIESLFLDIQNILVINNPLWKFHRRQKSALDKRVIFVNNYKEITNLILKEKKKILRNKLFINKYYNPKKNGNFEKILNQLIG